jgi:ATP/maltotriose-dependent transcriptional regulator MalT
MSRRVDDLKGRRQLEALAEINADVENVRAAWNWAAASKNESMLEQMLEGLWLYCHIHGRQLECAAMMQDAKRHLKSAYRSKRLWGRLLSRAEDADDTEKVLNEALQIAYDDHSLSEIGFCLNQLATAAHARREFAKTKQLLVKSLENYRRSEDDYYVAMALFDLQGLNYEGSWEEFKRYGEESFHLSQKIGDRIGAAWSVSAVAMAHAREGRFAEAERLWLERIALGYETGNLELISRSKGQISQKIYFFLGEFEKARATAEDALRIAISLGELNGGSAGWARASLGLVACMDEDYQTANQFFQQVASAEGLMWIVALATFGLSLTSCGLEDYAAAEEYLLAAFDFLAKIHGAAGIIAFLAVGAIILAHRGDTVRAVELLALAFTHPIQASGWMEKWDLLTRLRADLEATLGSELYSTIWQHGKALDADDAATDLRSQFRELRKNAKEKSDVLTYARLTDRELDVLRLVAVGCPNQEIADRLFVGVSTVKKHINHIYDKLGVKNRTQAVAHARELHILT